MALGTGFTMTVEFVVDSKNASCQQQELGDHGAVAGGYLVGIGDCQREKSKADGSTEAADCYGVLYGAGAGHGGYSVICNTAPYCSPLM